ncbi:hypothetical protein O5286_29250, partial [Escherichia coli]|nr:hypothetical protein [Escherichia coli]
LHTAGLIKLVFAEPKIPDDLRDNLDDNNTQLIEWFESYYNHVHIRHCDDAHYSEAHWNREMSVHTVMLICATRVFQCFNN